MLVRGIVVGETKCVDFEEQDLLHYSAFEDGTSKVGAMSSQLFKNSNHA